MNMGALSGLHTFSCVVRTKTSQQRFQSILRTERTISLFKEAQLVSGEAGLRDVSVWQGLRASHSPTPLRCTLSCRSQGPMPKFTASLWVSLPMRGLKASPRIMETEPAGPVTSQRLYCLTDYMTLDNKDSDSMLRCSASDNFQEVETFPLPTSEWGDKKARVFLLWPQ